MNLELWNPKNFDELRRQLIPSLDLLYDCVVDIIEFSLRELERVDSPLRILDLGAGTGLISARIYERIPKSSIILLDHSERMLEQARFRFSTNDSIDFLVGNLNEDLPCGPFDAIVSGLAIHHLTHAEKKSLFERVYQILKSGGTFVNADQIAGKTPRLERLYDDRHEDHVQRSETPAHEWAAGRERMKFDICAGLEAQITWMQECGFVDVDCVAKDGRFATYVGWKP